MPDQIAVSDAPAPIVAPRPGHPVSLALDTDIGTDVDDLIALAMILGSPDLQLPLVTTVYGDVGLRARITAKVIALAGRPGPRILAGSADTRSGREVWWPGHEGSNFTDLDEQEIGDGDAIAALAASAVIAAIGPLTNIAAALERPDCRIEQIVIMGGEFSEGIVEHNIRCDIAAAADVLGSGVPVLAVGLDQTQRVRLGATELTVIAAAGALGAAVAADMRTFWHFADQDHNVPHDPVAILSLARPDLFETRRGRITVVRGGDEDGLTTFESDPDGPHQIVTDLDPAALVEQIVERVARASRSGSAAVHPRSDSSISHVEEDSR